MELKQNDWIKTDSGEIGQVVHISRLTVFVAVPDALNPHQICAFLESQLVRVEPPDSLK
jgi:hypothetical protein